MSAKGDRYKYFKIEAREILDGLGTGVLELEKGTSTKALFALLLRLAHTLKGASRVVKQPKIAEQAHGIEGVLTPYREGGIPVPDEAIREILRSIELVETLIAELDVPVDATRAVVHAAPSQWNQSVRVEVGEMDALLEGIAETGVHLSALGQSGATIKTAQVSLTALQEILRTPAADDADFTRTVALARETADELAALLDRVDRGMGEGMERVRAELVQVRDTAHALRLLPASTLFSALERASRDAAQSVGKRIVFETKGGDVRLDASIVVLMRDALLHIAINAVAHGIETPDERARLEKPLEGRITLVVERRGDRVAFTLSDDGRGVDVVAIRRAAVARGVVSESDAKALGLDEAVALVLAGGLSTAGVLTEVSGRGIGLDVVRTVAERLRGHVSVESTPSSGTRVEVLVPVSLSSVEALQMDAGGIAASIPLHAVRCAVRLTPDEIARTDARESIVHEGRVIPFAPLESTLRRQPTRGTNRKSWSAVIVDAGGKTVAMGVDRLLGTAKIIVRAVPARAATDPVVAGTTFDAEGNPELVLDPDELIRAVRAHGHAPALAAARPRAPVLVIDDSLTTRMLEKSILESAGYEVDLATSAEEALAKARERTYCLFLCDVEMPGMDGFAFVALTREDQTLRNTPAILVTSRNAPEDKHRGQKVGASAYIVKSAFDQGVLLELIERLVG